MYATKQCSEKNDLQTFGNALKYEIKEEIHEEMKTLKSNIFDRLDDISAKLEAIQEDQTLKFHQVRELREKVVDHKKRITSLEPKRTNNYQEGRFQVI